MENSGSSEGFLSSLLPCSLHSQNHLPGIEMLNVVYFCDHYLQNRAEAWAGMAPGTNRTKRPFLSPGEGLEGGDVSLSHLQRILWAQEGSDAAGTIPSIRPGSLQLLLNKLSPAKRWKRSSHDFHYLIVFSTLNLIEAASRELHLETDKTFASCFADYRSCTFYFKHQWVATAIQMIWKLLLYTEMSLKQQSKRLAQSFAFYLFSSLHFNKTPQWKTLWWLRNNTCIFEHFICTKLQNIRSLLCNYYDSNFQLKCHSLSETMN